MVVKCDCKSSDYFLLFQIIFELILQVRFTSGKLHKKGRAKFSTHPKT